MQRRTFIEWTIYGLSAVCATVLGVPAVAFLTDARNRAGSQSRFRTVTKLSELEIGKPREFVLRETRRDAWNLHPDDVVGRVWLVRRPGNEVDAFTNICPHLGCSVNSTSTGFECPCHGAKFNHFGKSEGRPAPRDMDKLPIEKEALPEVPGQQPDFEIKVEYKRFKTSVPVQEEIT